MSDPGKPEVWVVACGDASRRRAVETAFTALGVCAIGPAGDPEDPTAGLTDNERRMLRLFRDAPAGDLVILRGGTRDVLDIGRLGGYQHRPDSGIASWDLAHQRDVTWLGASPQLRRSLSKALKSKGRSFPRYRFSKLAWDLDELRSKVRKKGAALKTPRAGKAAQVKVLTPTRFSGAVKAATGKARTAIDTSSLTSVVEEASAFGTDSYVRLEADTVAMVLVPLLMAIGVPHRNIRVEVPVAALGGKSRERIDVVVFADEGSSSPILLIEAKRRWQGLDGAGDQVLRYASRLPVKKPPAVMVTDGADFSFRLGPAKANDQWHGFSLQWPTEAGARNLARLAARLQRAR